MGSKHGNKRRKIYQDCGPWMVLTHEGNYQVVARNVLSDKTEKLALDDVALTFAEMNLPE